MEDQEVQIHNPMEVEDDVALMPDGWTEDTDIFSDDFAKSVKPDADVQQEETVEQSVEPQGEDKLFMDDDLTKAFEEAGVTVESTKAEEKTEEPTKPEEEPKPTTRKFKVRIDHKDAEVDISDDEIPTLYQKAHATERAQNKLAKLEKLAKHLEYDDVEDFYKGTVNNIVEQRKQELMDDGAPEAVAEDLARREVDELLKNIDVNVEEPKKAGNANPEQRDYKAEVSEALALHPELIGKAWPEGVITLAKQGMSMNQAYEKYLAQKQAAELEALRKENQKLKQNAEAATRAPVRGTAKSGIKNEPDDPFLIGFNKGY